MNRIGIGGRRQWTPVQVDRISKTAIERGETGVKKAVHISPKVADGGGGGQDTEGDGKRSSKQLNGGAGFR